MKRLLCIIAFLPFYCFGQNTGTVFNTGATNQATIQKGATGADSAMVLPIIDTTRGKSYLGSGSVSLRKKGRIIVNSSDSTLYYYDGGKWKIVGGADSAIFPTQYQLDTAKDNIRGEIAAIPTPTLQTVTDAGDSSDNTLYIGGLNIYGFERPPGQFDGGAAIYIRRYQCTGCDIDTAFGNSIHGYMERSVLSIGNNKSYASFDAIPAIYSDSIMNMSAMTGFQNNSIWDYPVGSILDKMYGFNSVLVPKTGTVNNIYDFYAHHLDATGTPATIGDHYAFYSEDFAGANTASRNHGIYLYGTASDNYFAGNVGIGDTNRGSYKLEVSGASNLNGAAVVGGTLTLNSVSGGTEDSALALNASNQVIKVPMTSTTPTLAQVTTAGATTTNSVTVGTLTVDNPSDADYSALDFSGGVPRLSLFNSGIALGNLTMNASGLFAFDRGVSITGNLTVSGTLTMSGSGFLSGGGSAPQLGALSLWAGAGTSPFIELSRAGVARDWHIGSVSGNLVFNSAPSTSANISGTTMMTLNKTYGFLGIKVSPSQALHVGGQVKVDTIQHRTVITDSILVRNSGVISSRLPENYYTGYADYTDTLYTTGSPFTVTGGTKVTLPNRAHRVRDAQKPIDITTFYNSTDTLITGRNGDGLNLTIEFKVRPTTPSITKVSVTIDIGGSVGEIYPRDFILTKGSGVEHYYLSSFSAYTLDTWEANGGKVKVSVDNNVEIYDIRYVLTRTHKAR